MVDRSGLESLYVQHLAGLQHNYADIMDQCGYDGVLIHSGSADYFFADDQQRGYRVNPHFLHWLPLDQQLNCCLWIRPGMKPRLYYFDEVGFWHQCAGKPSGFWVEYFDIVEITNSEAIAADLRGQSDLVFVGSNYQLARQWGLQEANPLPLLAALDWNRGTKSAYEIACLSEANRIAVKGHLAVERQFDQGASEFSMLMAYQEAVEQRETELPYGSIIALNEHASILHYQHYDRQPPNQIHSLLIDAGANFNGYGADITRSYSRQNCIYSELITALDQVQQRLIASISAGQDYLDLHRQMCLEIGVLLQQIGLVKLSPQQQLDEAIVTRFFPHGLGHLLGLQTHDVGGLQSDALGTLSPAPADHPFLRLTRRLEPGMVFTVEPGIYFIDSLLSELKSSKQAPFIDWELLESLRKYGGIRIEDNIAVMENKVVNLTRQAFEEVA